VTAAFISEDFRISLAETLSHEGGFVNHPRDPGGMTNLGVTRKTWASWTGRKVKDVTEVEMRALTIEKVMVVYHRNYWLAVRGDDLPGGVNFTVFDIAVNSGPQRAVKMLQKAVNQLGRVKVAVDGRIGPKTLSAAAKCDTFDLINEIANTRLWFYIDLATFRTFGKGWMRRLIEVSSFATIMAVGRAVPVIMARRAA
jgi:lysozyme family protein